MYISKISSGDIHLEGKNWICVKNFTWISHEIYQISLPSKESMWLSDSGFYFMIKDIKSVNIVWNFRENDNVNELFSYEFRLILHVNFKWMFLTWIQVNNFMWIHVNFRRRHVAHVPCFSINISTNSANHPNKAHLIHIEPERLYGHPESTLLRTYARVWPCV